MPQPNPFTRHIKPKLPEPWWLRIWGFLAAGIVYAAFGVGAIFWNSLSRDRLGRRKRSLRHLDDL